MDTDATTTTTAPFIVHRGGAQVKLVEYVQPRNCNILAEMFLCDYVQWAMVLANVRNF